MSRLKWTLGEAVIGVPLGILLYDKPEVGAMALISLVAVGKVVGELISRQGGEKK